MGSERGVTSSYDAGPAKTVLVAVAEPQVRSLLCAQLARCGVLSISAASIAEAGRLLEAFSPDALLIDIDVNRASFAHFHRRMCEAPAPFPAAMLTSEVIKACGYEREICGADECVPKPVHPGSLVRTMISLLEGSRSEQLQTSGEGRIRRGLLALDLNERIVLITVSGNEEILDVAPRGFRLLSCLMAAPDVNHGRAALLSKVWPEGGVDERTIDVSIMRLRKRLKPARLDGAIVTVPGRGYRFSSLIASTTRAAMLRSSAS